MSNKPNLEQIAVTVDEIVETCANSAPTDPQEFLDNFERLRVYRFIKICMQHFTTEENVREWAMSYLINKASSSAHNADFVNAAQRNAAQRLAEIQAIAGFVRYVEGKD